MDNGLVCIFNVHHTPPHAPPCTMHRAPSTRLTHDEYAQIDAACIRWGAGFELMLDALSLSTYVDRQQLHIVRDREPVISDTAQALLLPACLPA